MNLDCSPVHAYSCSAADPRNRGEKEDKKAGKWKVGGF